MNTIIDGAMGIITLIMIVFLSTFYYELRRHGKKKIRIQNIRRFRKLIAMRNENMKARDREYMQQKKKNDLGKERQTTYAVHTGTPAI